MFRDLCPHGEMTNLHECPDCAAPPEKSRCQVCKHETVLPPVADDEQEVRCTGCGLRIIIAGRRMTPERAARMAELHETAMRDAVRGCLGVCCEETEARVIAEVVAWLREPAQYLTSDVEDAYRTIADELESGA
ncbi:MAG TPA: hypothetical protein VEA38_06415, partial [Terriglobales bacterium]|nr:hypothetical protein [Terriglobales bacterium]